MYKEGPLSQVLHLGRVYKVDDIIRAANEVSVQRLAISELTWMLTYLRLDKERVRKADYNYPIIVTYNIIDGKRRCVTLDGAHRFERAFQEGLTHINVRVIDVSNLESTDCLTLAVNESTC